MVAHFWNVTADGADGPKLLEVKKIWDAGKHNAFTDLIRVDSRSAFKGWAGVEISCECDGSGH